MITTDKIQRMEQKYGQFEKYLKGGWMVFEKALVSSDEKVFLKSEKTPHKYDV